MLSIRVSTGRIYLLTLITTLIFISCKKEHVEAPADKLVNTEFVHGVPEKSDTIDGFLYAGYRFTMIGAVPTQTIFLLAVFSEPARRLSACYNHYDDHIMNVSGVNFGNVDVGAVTFNSMPLNKIYNNNNFHYRFVFNDASYLLDNQATWNISGNKVFPALLRKVEDAFPVISDSGYFHHLVVADGFFITPSKYLSNYDSVSVSISSKKSLLGGKRKTVPFKTPVVGFTPQELNLFVADTDARLVISAFRYFNVTTNSKTYMFEFSNKIENKLMITRK